MKMHGNTPYSDMRRIVDLDLNHHFMRFSRKISAKRPFSISQVCYSRSVKSCMVYPPQALFFLSLTALKNIQLTCASAKASATRGWLCSYFYALPGTKITSA